MVGKDMGYDCGSLMTYQWDRTSNFQDTLTNVQWHYSLDDMDQNTAPASAGVKSHPEIVIDVVNSKPLPIEKAAVEMKGRIFGRPLFVTYCSNYEFGRLKGHIVSPAPFWRRFPFHVKVTAKEPFAMPDGSLNKVAAADSTTHDMWELEVRRYNPPAKIDNPHETLPYGPVEKMTFPEFARLVRSEYRKHAE